MDELIYINRNGKRVTLPVIREIAPGAYEVQATPRSTARMRVHGERVLKMSERGNLRHVGYIDA